MCSTRRTSLGPHAVLAVVSLMAVPLLTVPLLTVFLLTAACSPPATEVAVPGTTDAVKTAALQRAERRSFDGAPPAIPHTSFGIACTACHNLEGVDVEGVGYAPPSPHGNTQGMSAISRCQQCHVFARTDEVFSDNTFVGLRQDLRSGGRLHAEAPPTLPHKTFMRENCIACHTGPAAREEIRTSHPERANCRQCHVGVATRSEFSPAGQS